ncbi:MAG: hypothetical protein QW406_04720, partial [Ignisphaera sp.]
NEEIITILKTLQGHSWDTVARILGVKKQKLLDDMKKTISKLLNRYFSISEENMDKMLGKTSIRLYVEKIL